MHGATIKILIKQFYYQSIWLRREASCYYLENCNETTVTIKKIGTFVEPSSGCLLTA
jgi:hypothetical protein